METLPRFRAVFHEHLFAVMTPEYESDINCLFVFSGHIDVPRLQQALQAAIAETSLWGYRYEEHWWTSTWRPLTKDERANLITLIETDDLHASEQQVLVAPITRAVQLYVLRTRTHDQVCVRIDHRLADAAGSRIFLAALREHYEQRTPPPAQDAPPKRELFDRIRGNRSVEDLREVLRKRRELSAVYRNTPRTYRFPAPQSGDVYRLPRLLQYPEGSLDQLRARALQDRATPAMALQAAAYLALREMLRIPPEGTIAMPIMVDLRRYLPRGETASSASMYVGMVHLLVEANLPDEMPGVLPRLNELLRAHRGPMFGLLDSPLVAELPLVKWFFRWLPISRLRKILRRKIFAADQLQTMCVTDQGDFGSRGEIWGETTLERAFCSTGVWKVPSISIGFSTSGSQISISVATGPDSFAEQLATIIDRRLKAYVGWTADFGGPRQFGDQPFELRRTQ